MKEIFEPIMQDMLTLTLMMVIFFGFILVNTLLSSINAWSWGEWKSKKFLTGLLKNVCIGLALAAFFFLLELVPIVLKRVDIVIPQDVITTAEIFGTLTVALVKTIKDIWEQFLILLGVNKEEIEVVDYNVDKG